VERHLIKPWTGFALTLVAMLMIPVIYLQAWDSVRTVTLANQFVSTGNPDYAFIGHSYTGSRIDVATLESQLDGQHAALVWGVSAGPDIWYLMLKNNIVASGETPKYVFTFFSGNQLDAEPAGTTSRRQIANLLQFSGLYEPEYDALFDEVGLRHRLIQYTEIVFPTRSLPSKVTDELARATGYGLTHPSSVPKILDPTTVLQAIFSGGSDKRIFDEFGTRESWHNYVKFKDQMSLELTDKELRKNQNDAPGAQIARAEGAIKTGLSPAFINLGLDLAAEHGITWVFVRARLQPLEDGSPRHELEREYVEGLEDWLTSRGAILIDLSERDDISDEWFSDDFHTFGHQPEYTEWFYQEFKDQFFN